MKIIIIGPAWPLRGGISNFNESLCSELLQQGHECSIVSFSLQYPGFLFPGTTQFAKDDPAPSGIEIKPLINSVNPLSWFRSARWIAGQNPDLIIVRYWLPFMGPCLGTLLRRVRKKCKARVIAITDNVVPHESRPGDRQFTSYFLKACDGFVAMSHSVADDLSQFARNKPVVVRFHPVYDIFGTRATKLEGRTFLNMPDRQMMILFFGFIRKYKGLDLLLEAMADPRIRKAEIKLVVAGEFYEDASTYHDLVSKLNIREQVIFHDHYIPKEQVRLYFAAANLVAQPYRDATQSGVTQIAYHFGRPMLVTRVGGLPEMVPDRKVGYVTEPSPVSIADALFDFFSNNRESDFEKAVDEKAAEFSWDGFAKAVLEI